MALTLDFHKDSGAVVAHAYIKIAQVTFEDRIRIGDTYQRSRSGAVTLAIFGSAQARAAGTADGWKTVVLPLDLISAMPMERDGALTSAYDYLKTQAEFAQAEDC